MESIKQLYKIGTGPSSSHTMGPQSAALEFKKRYPVCDKIIVTLYGSLALTGKGHLTDFIILKTFQPTECLVIFDTQTPQNHANTLEIKGYYENVLVGKMIFYSIGGGNILIEGEDKLKSFSIYPHKTFDEIAKYCLINNLSLDEYVDRYEANDLDDYLEKISTTMRKAVARGLNAEGLLPGKLQVSRKAKTIYEQNVNESEQIRKEVLAYAYAVSEENAAGGEIVTAPTCGSAGVLPACLEYAIKSKNCTQAEIIRGLKVAGLIGNLIKHNATISGAVAGCQAEVGAACAMAAAFMVSLDNRDFKVVERATEIALEHHLGLTCDPVAGYVQIPCIERNAVAALRAIDAAKLATYLPVNDAKISFDMVVKTMLLTGQDLKTAYRETAEGGLAKVSVGD